MKRMTIGLTALAVMFVLPVALRAFPQVPENVKPNPPGLERPKHLGSEWPKLNIDEKLYSLRYTSLRGSYETFSKAHTETRTSPYPYLREQFGMFAYEKIMPEYYGQLPPEEYHQPFKDKSPCLTGATGLIDIPSAFTQRKGTWLASLSFSSNEVSGPGYFPVLYNTSEGTDIKAIVTYGYRDDTEFTLILNVLDREFLYANDAIRTTSGRMLFGLGGKLSFPTYSDHFQVAVGGMWTMFKNEDRDIIRIVDYDSLANLYLSLSTDTRLFNAHVMFKLSRYDYKAGPIAPIAAIGDDPALGYGPADTYWGTLGLGIEYKVPKWDVSFINEFTKIGYQNFLTRKNTSYNFGINKAMAKADIKAYFRGLNHEDFREIGLMATYGF